MSETEKSDEYDPLDDIGRAIASNVKIDVQKRESNTTQPLIEEYKKRERPYEFDDD